MSNLSKIEDDEEVVLEVTMNLGFWDDDNEEEDGDELFCGVLGEISPVV